MRLQSAKKIEVRSKIIGGQDPLICVPLVAEDENTLLQQAKDIVNLAPDLIEWRVDRYAEVKDADLILKGLKELRAVIREIPLIFTCRHSAEGGFKEIDQDFRLQLIKAAVSTGWVDMVDFEISNGERLVSEIRQEVTKNQSKLILSYHNFQVTPDESLIVGKLKEAQALGADIAKLAVMPRDYRDVLNLLRATLQARMEALDIPIITISMGAIGVLSRIAGGLFGSDITFAVGQNASAPGQIPITDLRKIWKVLPFK